ncbi:LysR family transcriptional regulator [Testudinibacter sp. TR-2022]|uniref:LysR family transcriptional regulator n=1 Tax=Testudinibacter sp. TR-2022 TaxID=2585029 RepID=UPI00111B9E3C|nr:LysR family transcriptional regulator [Testudinibacter sp. TR-2022]TNH01850.1 LysR family transcriptional regulator [Pasteurellaceae bacterium Phil31]TNH09663.1 LysR family transcriptional regulator [Testudinibacter sp. TR-2022]TNH10014.1 LysR family transcriptional regulator [Testudinibacter sp. TR-2022]TNH14383.1 LysR family transcriptional regulator [Testudinibacter sp. TR-2022]TNH18131.1 LysR family transcriptional regulator [Testudinibacter sp. TR-2022]
MTNKIQQIKLFTHIVETGSFSRAAEIMNISNGAASRQMRDLEKSLDTALLRRTTRSLEVTHEGRAYYEKCLSILADLNEFDAMFRQNPTNISGPIRMGMEQSGAQHIVIPRLSEFLQRYPNISVELLTQDMLTNPLADGFDCMLRTGHLLDGNYIAKPLYRLVKVNCASQDYLSRYGTPMQLTDLPNHRFVRFRQLPEGFEYFDSGKRDYIAMPSDISVNNLTSLSNAATAGMGIIQTYRYLVEPLLTSGCLVEILPQFRAESLPVCLLYPHKSPPQRVRVFMNWLENVIAEYIQKNPKIVESYY